MAAITPLAHLKLKAVMKTKPADLSLTSWIDVARKTIAQADTHERAGNEEGAYVEWMKWAQIMKAVIAHPDYKASMRAKNAEYLAYQDLKQRFQPSMQHIAALEAKLAARETPASLPAMTINGLVSPVQSMSPSTPQSSSFEPMSPVASTSKLQSPDSPKKRPISGGLASRMAALQSAGMSVDAPRGPSAERARPPESAPVERPPEAPRISQVASPPSNGAAELPTSPVPSNASLASLGAPRGRRPLPPTPMMPTSVPLADGADMSTRNPVLDPPSPLPSLGSTSRPASAPAADSYVDRPTGLSTEVPSAPSQPSAITAFGQSFPDLDEFDNRFPDVPTSAPGRPTLSNGIPTAFSPPSTATKTDFGAAIPRSPAFESLRSPPQETAPRFSEDGAAMGRARHTSQAIAPTSHTLPRTNYILPDALWAYLQPPPEDQPSVLLLDVRDRSDFDRCRIRAGFNVCIEPFTLRQDVSSNRIEQSLVLSTEAERHAFMSRDRFDLVVIYDRSSTTIPAHAPGVSMQSGGEDPARSLFNLHSAIFEREYHRSLRRPPVILVGGIEAWSKAVGAKGLEGGDVASIMARSRSSTNASVAEASARLEGGEGQGLRRSSLSSTDAKRSHRKASINPPEAPYGQPALSRSVVDVLTGNPYNGSTSGNYFSRPSMPSGSTSYVGSPITSPPVAAMPALSRQMSGSNNSNGFDYPQGYTSPPRQRSGTVDYPTLASHAAVPQRPPLAAQPNGAMGRPPPLMPHVQRLSSSTFSSGASAPTSPVLAMSGSQQLSAAVNWGDGTVGMTGLKNLGNTCYMNSTLQCLSATVPLARFFKDGSYKRAINRHNPLGTRGALAEAVAQLFGVLWSEQYNFVSPVTFRDAICRFASQFQGTDQHDSQEFLAFLLDGLHEDLNFVLNKPPPISYTPEREAELEMLPQQIGGEREWNIYLRRENSVIVAWFQGQYRSKLQCLTCAKTSTTYNNFMYLTLALPSHRGLGHSKVTLESLLQAYVQEEYLDKDDAWNCPRCKVPRRASKKLSLSRLPPVLIIHLKRFQFRGPFSDKIDTPVHFPLHGLDMSPFIAPPLPPAQAAQYAKMLPDAVPKVMPSTTYDLYAVSEQIGTLSSGHYTAHVRSRDRWSEIGDSKVRSCDENDVRKSVKTAYILFYRRR